MSYLDVQLEGLPGPFHHYGGLSEGNLASIRHAMQISSPRQAALECLALWHALCSRNVSLLMFPPHPRPYFPLIIKDIAHSPGIMNTLNNIQKNNSELMKSLFSSSGMWTANVATFSPSFTSMDKSSHLSIANLQAMTHRRTEYSFANRFLKQLFQHTDNFKIHTVAKRSHMLCDEGAANHLKLYAHNNPFGIDIFVYDRIETEAPQFENSPILKRHSLASSINIAKKHGLIAHNTFYLKQHSDAIQCGVFHNDVISFSFGNYLVYHEKAFHMNQHQLSAIKEAFFKGAGKELKTIEVSESDIPLHCAVKTYIFNSQIIHIQNNQWLLIAPIECKHVNKTLKWLNRLKQQIPEIKEMVFIDLAQSMKNGGGPACLRFQMFMRAHDFKKIKPHFKITPSLIRSLELWVNTYYPDILDYDSLLNTSIIKQGLESFFELEKILNARQLYPATWKRNALRLLKELSGNHPSTLRR